MSSLERMDGALPSAGSRGTKVFKPERRTEPPMSGEQENREVAIKLSDLHSIAKPLVDSREPLPCTPQYFQHFRLRPLVVSSSDPGCGERCIEIRAGFGEGTKVSGGHRPV